jgi:S-adenosylmethionine synthetase
MSSFTSLSDNEYLFTSESVTEGHPDKMADQISDSVLDAIMEQDPKGRVACETFVTTGLVLVGGEITTSGYVDIPRIARSVVEDIGYTDAGTGFDCTTCSVLTSIDEQSPDIAQGVDHAYESRHIPTRETKELMPMPIQIAHTLAHRLSEVRKAEVIPYLRPDGKTQVTVRYENGKPVEIVKILISTQHKPDIDGDTLIKPDLWEHVVEPVLHADHRELYTEKELRENVLVNPTGKFEIGGPMGDAGLTGRKIIIDTYGGAARHGGGAFSGKDPSKVDRSAAYAARYVAKNVVAAGLADRCEIQVAYAIGVAHPQSLMVETYGTERVAKSKIVELVEKHFDLRPGAIIRDLDLRRPIFRKTAAYGHFGRDDHDFTWEKIDKADVLRREAGLDERAEAGAVSK